MKLLLAFHLIAMVCWFAGLFYLPRLFIYHAATRDAAVKAQFKLMEYRLYTYIMMPAMFLTLITGMMLLPFYLFHSSVLHLGWLWLKLFLVLLLVLYHFFCGHCLRLFAQDQNPYSSKFYRFFNEIPTLFLIVIVLLAVVKPF